MRQLFLILHSPSASLMLLLFVASIAKAQSFKPTQTIFPYYNVEITNYSTLKSHYLHQEGAVSVNLDYRIITISQVQSTIVDTFYIDRVKSWRKTSVDTGFTAQCSGGKERLKFVTFDIVDPTAFGYKASLMLVYYNRSVAYYMKGGISIDVK